VWRTHCGEGVSAVPAVGARAQLACCNGRGSAPKARLGCGLQSRAAQHAPCHVLLMHISLEPQV
jgi:hypothetical protein